MYAGTAKVDITPVGAVWMDGMLRAHPSEGVHDRLHARALVLSNGPDRTSACALVSVDVCVLDEATSSAVRQDTAARTGIPADHIIVAATHTHSGPATVGIFNPCEPGFVDDLIKALVALVEEASQDLQPAIVRVAVGREETISHYRRLLSTAGHVVMNWEPYPPEQIVGPLGEADHEVGVVQVVGKGPRHEQDDTLAILFNYAGHPNILSGDSYLLSADFPGRSSQLIEAELGGTALYFNGANGSVDIDGLRDRDWEGVLRAGRVLADSIYRALEDARRPDVTRLDVRTASYVLPGRRVTDEEWAWAQQILARTGGSVHPMADGVGDDYLAVFLRRMREAGPRELHVQQVAIGLEDSVLLTFPGELYTEIGRAIKAQSPFRHTFLLGLANGYVGYVPTRRAIEQRGYAEDTRRVDAISEQIVMEESLALLNEVYQQQKESKP